MAKISTVDYAAIPGHASAMRTLGQNLNSEITKAYESVKAMSNNWYGVRYNALIKNFNDLIPEINKMLTLVVTDIPYTLETVANNYSQADQGKNVVNASQTSPKKIQNIPTSSKVGLKFMTESVKGTQTSVQGNFEKAISKMNEIEARFKKITWTSDAATSFQKEFSKLKKAISDAFTEIKKQFKTLMDQTISDIEKAETSNTMK